LNGKIEVTNDMEWSQAVVFEWTWACRLNVYIFGVY